MSSVAPRPPLRRAIRRDLGLIVAAWLAAVGFDLLLHAGLLASLYSAGGDFLLPARDAFRRIPLGYLSFLILTALVWWVCEILDLRTWSRGLRAGAALGWTVWGAVAVGLYSISTAGLPLLVGWWLGQGAEMGVSGALIGLGRGPSSRRASYLWSVGIVLGCVVITILLQSLGLAPPMETLGG